MTRSSFCSMIWTLAGLAALTQAAIAQRGSGTSNNPPRTSFPSSTTSRPVPADTVGQPMFISGKVLLEGGGVLPEPVPIERVCNNVRRRETYTDIKGQFQFQLGVNTTFQDASENDGRANPSGLAPRTTAATAARRSLDLSSCELRAVLAGYQSTVAILRTTPDSWQTDIGTIFLKRIGNAPGTTISVTSMAAPKDAMRAYEKAQKDELEKPAEAEKELNKAVHIYPQFAAAWTLLGDLHRQDGKLDLARGEYSQALAADPQFVSPTYGLAVIAMQEKKWEQAILLTDKILKLNAGAYPLVYFISAAANYNAQNFDAAEGNGRKFKALDTQHTHPDVCLLLSYLLSRKRDFAGAAHEIRDYLAAVPNAPNAEALSVEAKRFEDLSISAKKN
ncbi:MAG: tetratricopeptide repeat protein [Candidatus Angelobacter sp.]